MCGHTLAEVHFQWKNLDFLSKNLDFLSKNLDFLSKSLDFLSKNLDFLSKSLDLYVANRDFREANDQTAEALLVMALDASAVMRISIEMAAFLVLFSIEKSAISTEIGSNASVHMYT